MSVENTRQKFLSLALAVRRDEALRTILSTSEMAAVALLLNRADWLDEMQMSLLGAIDRIGMTLISQLRHVEPLVQKVPDEMQV